MIHNCLIKFFFQNYCFMMVGSICFVAVLNVFQYTPIEMSIPAYLSIYPYNASLH